nr:phage baseplate assembly protein V [Burkholderia thailandensis]
MPNRRPAEFGHAFTPRVGAEVVIGFESGNIDMPVVLGQVYGGRVQPPFAAAKAATRTIRAR